jgi:glycosyltransferase involved in cell wall biosynthesis
MKIALIASSFLPASGGVERRVDQLARGLALRGAEVEIMTHGPQRSTTPQCDGVLVRRFPTVVGPLRFAVAPTLFEWLRLSCSEFDVVDVHTRHTSLALAVARTRARRLVFTPGAPSDLFLTWPHAVATRAVVASSNQIVCHSEIDRERLEETIPEAAGRTRIVPDGVDAGALGAAEPFATAGIVVLAVDRLDRGSGIERAIAAMLGLDPEFQLVVVGDGPARDRLVAHAADLRVAPRVQFVGTVSDEVLYRWLRTARVVVTLPGERGSGSLLVEAIAGGASVVASDLPVHREAAARAGAGHVIFVAPKGSPLDVADAIDEATRLSVLSSARGMSPLGPSWESAVESMWALYGELIANGSRPASRRGRGRVNGEVVGMPAPLAPERVRMNGRRQWR